MNSALARTWSADRIVLCGVVALMNGIAIGFQGNGNLLWTGVFLGLVVGAAWSSLLLFGLPAWVRCLHLSARTALLGALLITALILLPIVCVHFWGHGVSGPWGNKYWP
jgi:hypothetical protein